MDAGDVDRLDRALVRLRRLWSSPAQSIETDGRRIEMSSLLLLEAWAQLTDPEQPEAAVSIAAVRSFAAVQPSTMSRLLDRAVDAGLMTRIPGEADKRRWFVTATDAGRAMREQAVQLRTSWLRTILEQWSQDDVHAFARLVDQFATQVQRDGGPEMHRRSSTDVPPTPHQPDAAGTAAEPPSAP